MRRFSHLLLPSVRLKSGWRWPFLLVFLFLALGAFYSFTTPVFEAPDENWHYGYVREVATHRGFPVVKPGVNQPWAQEGSQPPLYYVVGAALISWMDSRELDSTPVPNPFARIGQPEFASNDNRNAYMHTAREAFPFHGASLAVHLLRLYSVLLGACSVGLTYLLARGTLSLASESHSAVGGASSQVEWMAMSAAAFVAFLPQFLFLSGSINNDNLAITLSTAALWQITRVLRFGVTSARALALGVLVGSALLAKLNTLGLIPIGWAVLLFLTLPRGKWRAAVNASTCFIIPVVLIAAWWYLRNQLLYGEPTGLDLVRAIIGERSSALDVWRWLRAEGEGLRLSMWGVFGWFNILASREFYLFFDLLALMGLVGMICGLALRRHLAIGLAILAGWCVVNFIALARYAELIPASQGRLLFPALPAFGVLWGWGVHSLLPGRIRRFGLPALAGAQFLAAALSPIDFIGPAYQPTFQADAIPPTDAVPLKVRIGNGVRWLGAVVDQSVVVAGGSVDITIYEEIPAGLDPPAEFVHLVNSADVIVAQRDSFVGSGNLDVLASPRRIVDSYRVSIPLTVPVPDYWRVELGMYDQSSGKRLAAVDDAGNALGESVALLTVQARAAPGPWGFNFDDRVMLDGLELHDPAVAQGGTLTLTLNTRVKRQESSPYHVFVHALGANDHIWSAADVALEKDAPASIALKFDRATPPGVYPLELGIYPDSTDDRLKVFDSRAQDIGDRIFLGPIRVTGD